MAASPFLDDPWEQIARSITLAVDSPTAAVCAIHLCAAEHQAALAAANGLEPAKPSRTPASKK